MSYPKNATALQIEMFKFLRNTVDFYSKDPVERRATIYDESGDLIACSYLSESGKKCAIGRHIPTEKYDCKIENKSVNNEIRDLMVGKYKNFPLDFFKKVQNLHDTGTYWCIDGLTKEGKVRVKVIKESILKYHN